ncbi:MAG: transcription antitermination factor NusB [Bdellovibrionales bacterium]
MMGRRQSRELAMQLLFQTEFTPKGDWELALSNFRQNSPAPAEVWEYAIELLNGVKNHLKDIDQLIERHSAHWKLNRMALVDLSVMRIAVYETKFASEPLPPAVAIDEAIEICKKFGTLDSGSFVNGILDQIVKQ